MSSREDISSNKSKQQRQLDWQAHKVVEHWDAVEPLLAKMKKPSANPKHVHIPKSGDVDNVHITSDQMRAKVRGELNPALPNHGGDRTSPTYQGDNITLAPTTERGTEATYTLRLRKDAPGLHRGVLAGELSPHAAMIEAGFRERRNTQARAAAIAQQNVLTFPGGDRSSLTGQSSVTTLTPDAERGASYLLARVRRDAPEVFARVQRGGRSRAHVISPRDHPRETLHKPCPWPLPSPSAICRPS